MEDLRSLTPLTFGPRGVPDKLQFLYLIIYLFQTRVFKDLNFATHVANKQKVILVGPNFLWGVCWLIPAEVMIVGDHMVKYHAWLKKIRLIKFCQIWHPYWVLIDIHQIFMDWKAACSQNMVVFIAWRTYFVLKLRTPRAKFWNAIERVIESRPWPHVQGNKNSISNYISWNVCQN